MKKKLKEEIVSNLSLEISKVKFIILTNYSGLNVEKITKLRQALRDAGVRYRVVKNSLIKRALKNTSWELIEPYFTGPTALLLSFGDPVLPSKALVKFSKDYPELGIKVGFLGNRILGKEEVKTLATLPSREVLLGKVLFLLSSPQMRLVNALAGEPRRFFEVLEAIKRKKEGLRNGRDY